MLRAHDCRPFLKPEFQLKKYRSTLLALSTVSSKNVCRAAVHTDSAAEQVLMQYAVLLGFHWNWVQLILSCIIVQITNYILDAIQSRRKNKKSVNSQLKKFITIYYFSFSERWGYNKVLLLLNSVGYFLVSVVKENVRYSTLNRLENLGCCLSYCTDDFSLSEQFSSHT